MTWDEVGVKHGTDKSSIGHDYLRHYERVLAGHDVRSVLEIGVDTGASLRTWCDIFPDADINGIDIREECRDVDAGRAFVLIGDATAPGWVLPVSDFTIDDGSHQVSDVLRSFDIFFPNLESGGIYAIEDIPFAVTGAPMGVLLNGLSQYSAVTEIWCGHSKARWGNAWPGFVLVTKA